MSRDPGRPAGEGPRRPTPGGRLVLPQRWFWPNTLYERLAELGARRRFRRTIERQVEDLNRQLGTNLEVREAGDGLNVRFEDDQT